MGLALVNLSPALAGAQAPQSGIQATAASLALPAGIAFDSAGNLYLADLNHHLIREVNIAGIATTVAGTGDQGISRDGGAATSALLDSPAGVVVDDAGNISATASLTIQTAALNSTTTSTSFAVRAPLLPISAAFFLLPFLRNKRVRARFGRMPRTLFSVLFLLIAGVAILGLTGCGSGNHYPHSTNTITVTASAAGAANTPLQHTATVTLIIQ
jgi:DNA-binding beta-propeller fold protein YncE